MEIFLACGRKDNLPELCIEQFGKEHVEVINRNGALSLEEVGIILSGISATMATFQFLYTVLTDVNHKKKELEIVEENKKEITHKDDNPIVCNRRVVVTKQGDISLENYNMDEIKSFFHKIEAGEK